MYKIPNANTPNTNIIQVLPNPGSFNFGFYSPSGNLSDLHKLYTLPDQIDNLDYSNLQTNALACCLKSKNYDIDYFNTSGTNVWQPGTPTTFSANLPTTIYIGKELKIKAGSTLTLNNMILKFSPEARLVVENGDGNLQGGILILNNTKLTVDDECDPNNLLWLGVEVWGNQNMLQGSWLNSNQGRLQLTNNSIIEHAFIGTLIGKRTTLTTTICNNFNEEEIQSFNFDDNRNGGIIQVINNSLFSQNQRGIWMRPYISPAALPNLSMAKNSNFRWLNNLNGGVNIQAHVTLESVKGVNFEGVNFENNIAANSSQFGMGIGVLSRSAQFTINRSCPFITTLYAPCPGEIKSLFKNLEFGIHATNNSDNLTFSVTNSEFKECKAGIHTIGTQNERIVRNTFFIREAQYNTVGISLFNSTGYRVMENNLLGNSSLPGQGMSYGIVAENSGTAPNLIYKNSFRELFVGGYSIKVNGSLIDESNFPNYMSSTGLKWKCNQFSSIINSYDLAINGRIDYNQGYAINFTSTDARNSAIANNFSLNLNAESLMNPVPLEHDIFVTNNSQPLRYVHLSDLNQIPDYYTLNKVAPIPASFLGIPILSQNKTCKSKLGKTTIQLVADLINAKNQIIDLKSTIDQGNSSFLFTLINSSSNPISIKNELILKSPFLSDSLLLTYLSSNAPSAFKKDVLLSNSTLTNYVLNAVINSNLPNGTKNQIINAQNGVSLKEQTFMSIDFYQSEFQDNYDEILSRLLLDTSSTAGYSEVINFLNSINDIKSKKTLTDIYLSLNDVQNMDNVKTSLQSEIVDPDYFELQNIKEQLKTQVSINYAIENSSSVVSQIENLALNSTNLHVKAKSKTLLEFRDDYSPLPDFLPLFTSNMIIEQNDIIEVPQNNNYEFVSMYPNPSEGFVYFDYPEITAGKLEVQLIDVNGKVIYTYVSLSDTNGEIVDLNHIENGFYIVNIIIDGLSIETKKLLLK